MGKLFGTDGIRGIANKDLLPNWLLKQVKAVHMCLQNILQKDREYLLVKIQENQVICLRRLLLPDFVRWAQRLFLWV